MDAFQKRSYSRVANRMIGLVSVLGALLSLGSASQAGPFARNTSSALTVHGTLEQSILASATVREAETLQLAKHSFAFDELLPASGHSRISADVVTLPHVNMLESTAREKQVDDWLRGGDLSSPETRFLTSQADAPETEPDGAPGDEGENLGFEGAVSGGSVDFPDQNLRAAISAQLLALDPGFDGITMEEDKLLGITELEASGAQIADLTGLEYCVNLTHLNLQQNLISDLSPLANLTNLTELNVSDNLITSLEPLAGNASLQGGVVLIDVTGNMLAQPTLCEEVPTILARLEHAEQFEYDGYCDPPIQLTLTVDGIGDIQPFTGTQLYSRGTLLHLSAARVAGGDAFSHWDERGPDSEAEIQITMDADQRHTAHFVEPEYFLTVAVTGVGTTNIVPGVYGFLGGQIAHLLASPHADSGLAFDRWVDESGQAISTEPLLDLTMTQNRTAQAIFTEGDFTLSVSHTGDGAGYTDPAPGVYSFLDNQTASLWGFPNGDNAWGGWKGDVESMYWATSILMDADKSVAARFDSAGVPLVLTQSGTGSLNPEPGTYYFVQDSVVPLEATALNGFWRFKVWSGDIDDVSSSTTVTMSQPRSVIGRFRPAHHIVKILVSGSGEVSPYAAGADYPFDHNDSLLLNTIPEEGHTFIGWSGLDYPDKHTQLEMPVVRDYILRAVFLPDEELYHTADLNRDWRISMSELLRIIQFYSVGEFHCDPASEDGYAVGLGGQACVPHDFDYDPQNWRLDLTELLRSIQFYNSYQNGYRRLAATEDNFAAGLDDPHPTGTVTIYRNF